MANNRNLNAGHNFERDVVNIFNLKGEDIIPQVGTARELSRSYDENKIDIVTRVIEDMSKFELAIQAKSTTTAPPYYKLLAEIVEGCNKLKLDSMPVVLHRHTKKANTRFVTKGQYAITYMEDFINLFISKKKYELAFNILLQYFEHLPLNIQKEMTETVIKLKL